MPDIFLSYSREDQAIARHFAEALEHEGCSVWWDQSLTAGEAFDQVTEQALDGAKAVVVLWSKRSVDSRWVRAEATQAHAANRLVPVMIEPCRRPIMFELTHTADLIGWQGDRADEQWRSFIDGLLKLVSRAGASTEESTVAAAMATPRRPPHKRLAHPVVAAIAVFALIVGALAAWIALNRLPAPASFGPIHVSLPFSGAPVRAPAGTRNLAIAPDGSAVAFSSATTLQIRSLQNAESEPLEVPCPNPFFSPDADWIGCIGGNLNLLKIPVTGGAPVQITSVPERATGASWGRDGTIVFATTEGLFRVSDGGGKPELLAAPRRDRGERLYAWPELLPGDQAVLFTVHAVDLDAPPQIVQLDLQSRESHVVLIGGSAARYASTGHLIYGVGEKLHAIRFDPDTGQTRGAAVAIPDSRVATALDNGAANFAVSANGTLVSTAPSPLPRGDIELFWVDHSGVRTSLGLEPNRYNYPRVSPDGKRVIVEIHNGKNRDLWMWDLLRASLTPITTGPTEDLLPVWSVDGQRVFFASNRGGNFDIYSQSVDGAGEARVEFAGPGTQMPLVVMPDGKQVLVFENFRDLSALDLGQHLLRPLLHLDSGYMLSAVSPDGRWIAYESKESGTQTEIYLRPYPDMAGRREKISIDGGRFPLWSRNGSKEIYYIDLKGAVMSAGIQLQPELQLGKVKKLFDFQAPPPGVSGQPYDISPVDGRFLIQVTRQEQGDASRVTQVAVVLNWFDELQKLLP